MNWSKARDWEVIEGSQKGYEGAISEARRRGLKIARPSSKEGRYWSRKNSQEGKIMARRKHRLPPRKANGQFRKRRHGKR